MMTNMIEIPSTLAEAKAFEWEAFYEVLEQLNERELTQEAFESWMGEVNDAHWVPFTAHIILVWYSRRDMTDEDTANHLTKFYKEIYPSLEPKLSALSKKAVKAEVTGTKYDGALQQIEGEQKLDASKTTKLETEDANLTAALNKVFSTLTANFDKEKLSYRELRGKLQTELGRENREEIWVLTQKLRSDFVKENFTQLREIINLRRKLAESASYSSYKDYIWVSNGRDFSIAQTLNFANTVKEVFKSFSREMMEDRARSLNISTIRPWDVDIDVEEGKSGQVMDERGYQEAAIEAFDAIDSEFSSIIGKMASKNHLDLMTRRNKTQDNYASYIYPGNSPLVFTNSAGNPSDLSTVLHECGHCIHYSISSSAGNDYWTFLGRPDLNETIATFIESIGMSTLKDIGVLDDSSWKLYYKQQSFALLNTFRMISNRDIFQHWLYDQSSEEQTLEAFDQFYLENCSTYGVDWSGQEEYLARGWGDIINFVYPFRTIEYSMAGIAQLLLSKEYSRKKEKTISKLKAIMKEGKRASLRDTMDAFDLPHPLEREAVEIAYDYLQHQH